MNIAQHLDGLEDARRQGITALDKMVANKTLLPEDEFVRRRGWTSMAMHKAREDGLIFSVVVRGRSHYVAALTDLPEDFMLCLVEALHGLGDSSKMIFILRAHGALRGATVLEAHKGGDGARVLELARGWSDEARGGHR